MSVQEVLSGSRRHWCERADALDATMVYGCHTNMEAMHVG